MENQTNWWETAAIFLCTNKKQIWNNIKTQTTDHQMTMSKKNDIKNLNLCNAYEHSSKNQHKERKVPESIEYSINRNSFGGLSHLFMIPDFNRILNMRNRERPGGGFMWEVTAAPVVEMFKLPKMRALQTWEEALPLSLLSETQVSALKVSAVLIGFAFSDVICNLCKWSNHPCPGSPVWPCGMFFICGSVREAPGGWASAALWAPSTQEPLQDPWLLRSWEAVEMSEHLRRPPQEGPVGGTWRPHSAALSLNTRRHIFQIVQWGGEISGKAWTACGVFLYSLFDFFLLKICIWFLIGKSDIWRE